MKSWYNAELLHQQLAVQDACGGNVLTEEDLLSSYQNSDLQAFFADLALLEGVPLDTLLCDEALLPMESLRFFYVDQNWVDCLLDGANSVGRNSPCDASNDALLRQPLRMHSYRNAAQARLSRLGLGETENADSYDGVRTGFLLRSRLVKGWPGLQVKCHTDAYNEIPVRLSILGDSILMCIAQGVMHRVQLIEPDEGLHFGFVAEGEKLELELVSLNDGEVGTEIPGLKTEPVYRENGEEGVRDILGLAEKIQQKLGLTPQQKQEFSALEFAVEMLAKRISYHHDTNLGRDGNE